LKRPAQITSLLKAANRTKELALRNRQRGNGGECCVARDQPLEVSYAASMNVASLASALELFTRGDTGRISSKVSSAGFISAAALGALNVAAHVVERLAPPAGQNQRALRAAAHNNIDRIRRADVVARFKVARRRLRQLVGPTSSGHRSTASTTASGAGPQVWLVISIISFSNPSRSHFGGPWAARCPRKRADIRSI
jgi:hypothetical protein